MPAFLLGKDAKLKYKAGGQSAGGGYTVLGNVRDLTLSVEHAEADVTTRASGGWRQMVATLKNGDVEFQMVWDPTDTGFTAIKDAFLNQTLIAFQVLDKDTAGGQGLQADFMVINFSRNEPLEEAQTVDVTVKVTRSDTPPSWITV